MNNAGKKTLSKCEEVQAVLFDYLARELGAAQSDVVREHLRRCESCRRAAAGLQRTMELLHAADAAAGPAPARLSAERHKRLAWAVIHPVLDWMYRHHILVSAIVALLALGAAGALMRGRVLWSSARGEGVAVTVGGQEAAPPELSPVESATNTTALMEEAATQMLQRETTNAAQPEN